MDATGVVADHAADGAAVMAGRIGGEGEVMFLRGVAEMIEDDSGLDAGDAALGINLEDVAHVLGEVEHHGHVAALAGKGSASAAAEKRSAEFAAGRDGGEDILRVIRKNHTDGDLAVVGSVGGVERASAAIEAHFPAKSSA